MNLTEIGNRLRNECAKSEYTWDTLAEKAGVSRRTLGYVFRGERSVTVENYFRIANALGVRLRLIVVKQYKKRVRDENRTQHAV